MTEREDRMVDIKPVTPAASLKRDDYMTTKAQFPLASVAPVVGMSEPFIRRICGRKAHLTVDDVLTLLDQDAFVETYIPRSKVLDYLLRHRAEASLPEVALEPRSHVLLQGHALDQLKRLRPGSVQSVVTSTPYWGLRIYKDPFFADWSDGERCPYGHEQTPEGFLRHTSEVLHALYSVLADGGSIWWNVMDSYNTRTQIRGNAAEALRAMQGKDQRSWSEHEARRYSAGHSFLKDGEQCLIPGRIAERASRLGYYVKSVITWAKTGTLPEPQESRVSRNLEYVIHLTKTRTPVFNRAYYLSMPANLGGRNNGWETAKLSDVWTLPTSSGREGHGAQFPIALPARCIGLSSAEGDVILDPFVGAGNTGVAAQLLGRGFIGIDVSPQYLATAQSRLTDAVRRHGDTISMELIDESSPDISQSSLDLA